MGEAEVMSIGDWLFLAALAFVVVLGIFDPFHQLGEPQFPKRTSRQAHPQAIETADQPLMSEDGHG